MSPFGEFAISAVIGQHVPTATAHSATFWVMSALDITRQLDMQARLGLNGTILKLRHCFLFGS